MEWLIGANTPNWPKMSFVDTLYSLALLQCGHMFISYTKLWILGGWKSKFMVVIYQWMLVLRQIVRAIWRIWYHNTSTSRFRGVTGQLKWRLKTMINIALKSPYCLCWMITAALARNSAWPKNFSTKIKIDINFVARGFACRHNMGHVWHDP